MTAPTFVGLVIMLLLSGTISGCDGETAAKRFNIHCNCSLINLIATPEDYDGKIVHIMGYAIASEVDPDYGFVYLTRDDAAFTNTANSILVDDRNSSQPKTKNFAQYDGKFLVIEGTFRVRDEVGVVEDIHRMEVMAAAQSTNLEPQCQ